MFEYLFILRIGLKRIINGGVVFGSVLSDFIMFGFLLVDLLLVI